MKVHVVRAPTRRKVLDETRRQYGGDALIMSVRRHLDRDGTSFVWEVLVGNENEADQPEERTQPGPVGLNDRVDEFKLPLLSKGLFNVVANLRQLPLAVRFLIAGKLAPILPKKNPGQENVRRLFRKVEDQE